MTRPGRARAKLRGLAKTNPLAFGAVILQAVAALVAVAFVIVGQGQGLPLIGGHRYEIKAEFANASGLKEGKQPPVTVAGVKLGIVTKVRYQDGHAIATMQLDEKAKGKVFRNASALITPRSALNDLTVDIKPGNPADGPLPEGSVLPITRTTGAVNLDRLAGILDEDTRAHLMVLIDQLDIGLKDRTGALGRTVQAIAPTLDAQRRVASAMADRRHLLSELVGDLDVVFTTLARRGDDLRDLIQAGARTTGVIANRQGELAAAMDQLGPALANVDASMSAVRRLSVPLNPALKSLGPFAHNLAPALRELKAFVPEGETLAGDLQGIGTQGKGTVQALRQVFQQLGPTAKALTPSVARFQPVLKSLDENKNGIGQFGSNFSGVFSNQDVNGPTLRAYGFFEPIRPENFGLPAATSGTALRGVQTKVASALEGLCLKDVSFACLSRYLQPGLPQKLVNSLALKKLGGPR